TAHSLGLGSCWIQIRNRRHDESMTAEDFIRNILDIPARFRIEAIVAIGNPAVRLKAAPKELLNYSKISWNSHGNRRR
ncbi:MAG: NAD(P)H-dependent dehydrogenase/reductase, partial [Deltaproteobacteria bacterium]|nr:NAD(P)H-dependent dehydrogenase/reductase [Deltaproteobacteria bacterium]